MDTILEEYIFYSSIRALHLTMDLVLIGRCSILCTRGIVKWKWLLNDGVRFARQGQYFRAPAKSLSGSPLWRYIAIWVAGLVLSEPCRNRMSNANVVARHTSFDHTECCTGHTNLLSLVVAVVAATIRSVQHSVALIDVCGSSSVSDQVSYIFQICLWLHVSIFDEICF